ncbi:hypothetical protein TrST_g2503 [Triparma strigata]|uniref:Uncharacterized protein n=1 Tax=Triparma strigata TaxID=1606541 RepID=A0A9W7F2I9_9STRA|nr:hypothetical protein TrST_g2503 [Triparma strigata]
MHRAALVLFFLLQLGSAGAQCFEKCNGHGSCDKYARCNCHAGFQGATCAERVCPFGTAFSDFATADDTAHAEQECSGRGLCDRNTGMCMCMEGFTGVACQRTTCGGGGTCNAFGKCMSMKDLASQTRSTNSEVFLYDTTWDAEKIYGCLCDEGRSGYDCGLVDCPTGDDPLTTGQVNEVQLMKCSSDPNPADSSLKGTFALWFNGYPSTTINVDATAAELESAIEQIQGVGQVTVSYSEGSTSACSTSDTNVIKITFIDNFGALPPIVPFEDNLYPVGSTITISADGLTSMTDWNGAIFTPIKGTKEDGACANRGTCDLSMGSCECYNDNGDTFASSDGYGNAGTRGDCGYAASTISACPGEIACSGQGTCDSTTHVCSCQAGFYGGNCALRECPKGLSWFSYPSGNEQAHDTLVECSNMGTCDNSVGTCECAAGFFGEACQYMACGGGTANPCSGHGECLSMRHLSWESNLNGDATNYIYGTDPNNYATWDADRVNGCNCDDGWEGYDCSLRSCPTGDNPGTYGENREVQLLRCQASSGTFALQFRQETTSALAWDIEAWELKQALEALDTVKSVDVTYSINKITSSTNSTYQPLKSCTTTTASPYCVVQVTGGLVASAVSGMTEATCKAACDVDATCNSFAFTAGTGACSYYDLAINATSKSSTSATVQSYWKTSDPLTIKGINKKGLCTNTTQTNVASLTFNSPSGDVPSVIVYSNSLALVDTLTSATTGVLSIATDGSTLSGLTSVMGTTDEEVCSGRGTCVAEFGTCTCHQNWGSSDGKGGQGVLADCGFRQDPIYKKGA